MTTVVTVPTIVVVTVPGPSGSAGVQLTSVVTQPTIVAVAAPGPQGSPGLSSASGYTHTQAFPAAVWGAGGTVVHGLGRRPAAVSLFSADYSQQFGQFVVQHLDVNSLRISMETPTAGIALIG